MAALRPSDDSALILRVSLPPALERLRRLHVRDAAAQGIPAHATLLYPFAEPASIDGKVRGHVAAVVGRHRAWRLTLAGLGRWPDALYATVEPDAPLRGLQADLAAAFPSLPLYGDTGIRFEPHVTVVEGAGVGDPGLAGDPAWHELPVTERVDEVQLIVRDSSRWRVGGTFPLRQ